MEYGFFLFETRIKTMERQEKGNGVTSRVKCNIPAIGAFGAFVGKSHRRGVLFSRFGNLVGEHH